jgi:hypothetical protein
VWIAVVVVALIWFTTIALDLTLASAARSAAVVIAAAAAAYAVGAVLSLAAGLVDLDTRASWVLVVLPGVLCGVLFRRRSAAVGALIGGTALAVTGMYVIAAHMPATGMGMTDWSWALVGHHFSCSPAAFAAWLLGGRQPPMWGWDGWGTPEEVPRAPVILIALAVGAANAVAALAAWWLARRWARWREDPADCGA